MLQLIISEVKGSVTFLAQIAAFYLAVEGNSMISS